MHIAVWLFVALAVLGAKASAQDITIAPRLREGDEFRLELRRTRENSSRPQQNAKTTTNIDVRVVSATAEGSTLEWTPGETAIDNAQLAQDPLLLAAADAARGMRLRLTLNADGEFVGLANEAEVAPKLRAVVDTIMRGLTAKVPAEQRQRFQAMMAQLLSPAALIASVTREAQMYFALNGVALAVGEAVEANIQQPSPLGRGSIPATFRVRSDSATDDSAVFTTTTTYDKAALQQITQGLAAQGGAKLSADELAKLPAMEMGDEGRYVIDRMVGLMREVVVNRTVTAGTNRRFDRWEIRLLKGPQR